jgi:hypothetical protein
VVGNVELLLLANLFSCSQHLLQFGSGMSSKSLCVEGLLPSLAVWRGGGAFKRWAIVGGLRSLGHTLEGIVLLQSSPSPGHEVDDFGTCCLPTGPKAMEPANHGLKPKFPLYKLPHVSRYSNRKLSNTTSI